MSKRHAALLLLAITLLAAGLRAWRLGDVPPGLWWDEGRDDWAALNILQGGPRPVYFTGVCAGVEPSHIYLTALWFRLFGVHYLAGRWVSALAGTLTVPALYWAAVEWLGPRLGTPRARAVGLLAAASLAVFFSHLLVSRIGFEIVLAPAGSVPTMAALGRGLRTRHLHWFALAGLTLGLTLYTGPTGRAAPLIVAAWIFALLLLDRTTLRAAWPGLMLLIAVTALTYSPLGLFYIQHPEWFFSRMQYVTSNARSGLLPLLANIWRTMRALVMYGDTYPRHNLPGRAFLDPIQATLLLIGLGLVLREAHRRSQAREWLFVPLWLLIALLPSALTDGSPSFTRALGAAPPAALLIALGGECMWRLMRSVKWNSRLHLRTMFLVLACSASAALSVNDYFVRYPARPELFDAYQVGLWETLREAQDAAQVGVAYLSPVASDLFLPTVDFVLRTTPQIRAYDGRVCQVFPRQVEQEVTFALLVLDDRASLPRLQALFPTGQVVREIVHRPEPYPFAEIFRVPAGAVAQIDATPVQVRFADAVELIAYRAETIGDTLEVTLYWHSLAPMTMDYTVFVHVQSAGQMVGQLDSQPCAGTYPTTRWRPGEVVMEQRRLPLPATGAYGLYVGLYDLATMQRLPVTAADVPFADNRAHIAAVTAP